MRSLFACGLYFASLHHRANHVRCEKILLGHYFFLKFIFDNAAKIFLLARGLPFSVDHVLLHEAMQSLHMPCHTTICPQALTRDVAAVITQQKSGGFGLFLCSGKSFERRHLGKCIRQIKAVCKPG